jgi:hypothetical protein
MTASQDQMNISTKKGKICVCESAGVATFKFMIDPAQLRCQCHLKSQPADKLLCKHLLHYFNAQGLPAHYLDLLRIPQVRTWLYSQGNYDVTQVKQHCDQFLAQGECCICIAPYDVSGAEWTSKLTQCALCRELFHCGCYYRWATSADRGCPRCKYVKGPSVK